MEERLQKLLSAAGVCSRRAAETYITSGRVTVNGAPAELGQRADPDKDIILVDGKPLRGKEEHVYLLLNKPRGYVTTLSDEKGRKNVADLEGEKIRPAQVKVLRRGAEAAELAITIHEGKNRQIRRMCAQCGLTVKRLRRVQEHTLKLGDLAPGKWRHLTPEEVEELKKA